MEAETAVTRQGIPWTVSNTQKLRERGGTDSSLEPSREHVPADTLILDLQTQEV